MPSRCAGSVEPSIRVSSAVRSSSGRSEGTASPSARTWFQYDARHAGHLVKRRRTGAAPGYSGLGWPRAVPHRAGPQPHGPRRRTTSRGSSCCRRTGRSSRTCSFADLVLWLPDRERQRLLGGRADAAHDRAHGVRRRRGRHLRAARAAADAGRGVRQGRLVREGDPEWRDDVPVRVETIPVRRAGRVIAVVARNTNLLGVRTPSRLELSYLQTAADLTQMIALRPLPGAGPAQRPRRLAAGRRRLPARRRRRAGWSTRARTRCRSTAGSGSPATSTGLLAGRRRPASWCRRAPPRRGDAQRGAGRPGAPRHRDRHRRGRR